MSYAKKMLFLLMLSLAASFTASAQDAHTKFTLSHNAVWGQTVLPAGTYSVFLEFGGITKAYVTSADTKLAFVAIPETTEVSDACAKSSVTLRRNGADWSVRSVCFGALQMAVYFPEQPSMTAVAALPSAEAVSTGR